MLARLDAAARSAGETRSGYIARLAVSSASLPKIDYPVELSDYAARSYRELKHEQLQLIGKLKPKEMQRR